MQNLFDLLTESDLTTDLKMLMDVCGLEIVKKLLYNCNGTSFYIPKVSHLDSFVIKYLGEHKDKPIKKIAVELGVSEPFLKNLKKK